MAPRMLCLVNGAWAFVQASGNPVELRDCPAAVSENDLRTKHWDFVLGSDGQ